MNNYKKKYLKYKKKYLQLKGGMEIDKPHTIPSIECVIQNTDCTDTLQSYLNDITTFSDLNKIKLTRKYSLFLIYNVKDKFKYELNIIYNIIINNPIEILYAPRYVQNCPDMLTLTLCLLIIEEYETFEKTLFKEIIKLEIFSKKSFDISHNIEFYINILKTIKEIISHTRISYLLNNYNEIDNIDKYIIFMQILIFYRWSNINYDFPNFGWHTKQNEINYRQEIKNIITQCKVRNMDNMRKLYKYYNENMPYLKFPPTIPYNIPNIIKYNPSFNSLIKENDIMFYPNIYSLPPKTIQEWYVFRTVYEYSGSIIYWQISFTEEGLMKLKDGQIIKPPEKIEETKEQTMEIPEQTMEIPEQTLVRIIEPPEEIKEGQLEQTVKGQLEQTVKGQPEKKKYRCILM